MDPVLLARIQFATTIGYHFIFAPLTIGLSWLILVLMTFYWRSGKEEDGRLARFWTKLFAISFVVGAATGLTMEFQFGTNWARYSTYVGDVFGPFLAIEVISSFFLESTFVAVMLLGWGRLSHRLLWFGALMVAVGATLSGFWILIANSWMQTPAGYALDDGHVRLTDFWAALFNPSMIPRFLHTINGALMTGAFFMLGISAWFLLKQRQVESARRTLLLAIIVAFFTSWAQLGFGHYSAWQIAHTQPVKLAAAEGLFRTQAGAPLILFGYLDVPHQTVRYALRFPKLLSFLATFNPNATLIGLDSVPADLQPPLHLTFYPFHLMVGLGLLLIGMSTLGVLLAWRKWLYDWRPFLIACLVLTPLPFLANETGWMTTEIGRQPWVVYAVFRTRDAISVTVPASQVLLSLILLGTLYTIITVFWVVALRYEIRQGPGNAPEHVKPEALS